ncbi:MAG: sulfatase-like hydrolase/transferase [Patescibacteria group bacterium]|nr:sulfatase-like hydrolase/transferase [Patescibacteria group bacterium]
MPAVAAPFERPNVVIVFCDDLGYGDLGCYGSTNHRTPNLDRLAEEGMRFTDFYAQANVCTPSRAALMTGCYAKRVGLQHRVLFPYSQDGLHPDEITLAEVLRPQGYATGCFGKWHLGHLPEFLPTAQGFDEYWGFPYSNDMGNHYYPRTSRGEEIDFIAPPLPVLNQTELVESDPDQRYLTARTTEKAIGFIERNRDKPFLCYVPLSMPHMPLGASPRFRGRSAGGFYGDVIEEIDGAVGQFMAVIDRLGLTGRTLVLFTSDNGGVVRPGDDAYGTSSVGPLRGRKGTTWEGGHRVPLIVRWPGVVPAGAKCEEMAMLADILPTVARLAGTTEPQDRVIDGKDLRPIWLGQAGAKCPHDAFYYYNNEEIHAVRGGDWKLHVKRPDWKQQGFEPSDVYLFNLRDDVGETKNVAAEHPEEVKRLTALIDRARKDLGDAGVAEAPGEGVRPVGMAASPPDGFLPEAIARMPPDSPHRSALEKAMRQAPPLAYKMRDWQWAEVDGKPLTLDAWWPHGPGPWPMVIWVHGGGWHSGFKELGNYTARRIASQGYVVLSINYRLAPEHPFPAAVEDCLGAIVWAKREAARFNGDPTRVAIAGESAGGNLAAMAAYAADSDRFHPTGARPGDPDPFVRAVIPVYGLFDFQAHAAEPESTERKQLLERYLPRGEADYAAASPVTWLDPHDPATLLICGDADFLYGQSVAFQKSLDLNQIDHEFFAPRGAAHAFIVWEWETENSKEAVRRMVAFLNRVLK